MSVPLSDATIAHVARLFAEQDRSRVERQLASGCAENLPLVHDPTPEGLERLRFAVLKLSGGGMDRFEEALSLAQVDWRDLLVAAGFGYDVNAHRNWRPGRYARAPSKRPRPCSRVRDRIPRPMLYSNIDYV